LETCFGMVMGVQTFGTDPISFLDN